MHLLNTLTHDPVRYFRRMPDGTRAYISDARRRVTALEDTVIPVAEGPRVGRHILWIPLDAILDCTMPGDCLCSVRRHLSRQVVNWQLVGVSRCDMVDLLADTGAWAREDLDCADKVTLWERVLWISCHHARDTDPSVRMFERAC